MPKKYIVFWRFGHRLGAAELEPETLAMAHKLMQLSLIQRDTFGAAHYEVRGVNKGVLVDKQA